jgi:hypothetical protein
MSILTSSAQRRPEILLYAPQYTHRSSGARAIYHLCTLLNRVGVHAAIVPIYPFDTQPLVKVPICTNPPANSVAIYPEIIVGNPLRAGTVIRWALNIPGRLGGDGKYAEHDLIFAFEDRMRPYVAEAVGCSEHRIGVLRIPVINPEYIYPGSDTQRTLELRYTNRGHRLRRKFKLPDDDNIEDIEFHAQSYWHLGHSLRSTKTLYSYQHASIILKEAIISGCEVLVMHEDGVLRDPRTCGCVYNQDFTDGFERNYVAEYNDVRHVLPLIARLDQVAPGWRVSRTPGYALSNATISWSASL